MEKIALPTPDQIAKAAEAKGLTIAALCRRADIDNSVFTRWKAGNLPSARIIQKLIDALEREGVA